MNKIPASMKVVSDVWRDTTLVCDKKLASEEADSVWDESILDETD